MRNTSDTLITADDVMLLSVDEAATVLGIGRTNVYALINRDELKSVKVGGRRLIPRAALEAFVIGLLE
jgi:excisionase family DNA binding protein